jgi:hypothetical protein
MHRIAGEDKIIVCKIHARLVYFECHYKVNWVSELDVVHYMSEIHKYTFSCYVTFMQWF